MTLKCFILQTQSLIDMTELGLDLLHFQLHDDGCYRNDQQTKRHVITCQYKLALTCDFQQCGIFTCVDLDKHVQSPFKFRHSK